MGRREAEEWGGRGGIYVEREIERECVCVCVCKRERERGKEREREREREREHMWGTGISEESSVQG